MSDLSDFKRRVHEPMEAAYRLALQDVQGVERVFDNLGVPTHAENGDLYRPSGRAAALAREVDDLRESLSHEDPE